MKAVDIGWTAGFLEGEGSFYTGKATIRITATQVEKDPLEKLMKLFGGTIYPHKIAGYGKKPVSYWNLGGPSAAALMMTLYPLMSARRQGQMRKALQAWNLRGAMTGDRHYSCTISDTDAAAAMCRVLAGEKLTQVARDLGLSHTTLSMWMKGANRQNLHERVGVDIPPPVRATGEKHYLVTVNDEDALVAMRRVKSGESMYSVAKNIGISSESLSFWMRGIKRPYLRQRLLSENFVADKP